ncbi:MAG: hypothetical protein AB7O52_13835 [Planctomycetota bacterium]
MLRTAALLLAVSCLSACELAAPRTSTPPVTAGGSSAAPRIDEEVTTPQRGRSEWTRNRDFENVPAAHVKTLSIRCGEGPLRVEGTTSGTLEVRSVIWAWAENPAESERICREVEVSLQSTETENPVLVVSEPVLGAGGRSYQVDLVVQVPAGVAVSIVDGGGAIDVSALDRGVRIENASGPVMIRRVRGGIDLLNQGGPTEVTEVSGRIQIRDAGSALLVTMADGEIDVTDSGGKLSIQHVTGTVTARGNRDGIDLLNIDGHAMLYGIPADTAHSSFKGVGNLSLQASED